VHIDAHLIGTAISNLVENALKYSPAHDPVDVSLLTENGHADVRVSDRGAGIVPEEQIRIFEKFYRAAAAQRLSGAGLGLYLARELAQRHGGDVRLIYSSATLGTCFSLTLPLPMRMPEQAAASTA
jgi:signal transduction histidine kinase